MPEGPEIHMAGLFINRIAKNYIFKRVLKSEVSKCMDIEWPSGLKFSLNAESRGKQLMLHMKETATCNGAAANARPKRFTRSSLKAKEVTPSFVPANCTTMKRKDIVLHFGMSGSMQFTGCASIPKHAHLQFWTDTDDMVLNFVDPRRFGSWTCAESVSWGSDRGPCIINEYEQFRKNVVDNTDQRVFTKPICEVLMEQQYFNGVGNYLRAEALHRCGMNPFAPANKILEGTRGDDLLNTIHKLALEVVQLGGLFGSSDDENDEKFDDWLQCYGKKSMLSKKDSNKRTVWYSSKQVQQKSTVNKRRKTDKMIV